MMDDTSITIEEYIRIEEEKAQRSGLVFDWKTAKFGMTEHYYEEERFSNFEEEFPAIVFGEINSDLLNSEQTGVISEYDDDEEDFETKFPAIVFNASDTTSPCEPTASPPNDKNDDNNIASSPNTTIDHDLDYFNDIENEFPTIVYNDGLTSKSDLGNKTLISTTSTDEFNITNETSLSEYEEEIISRFNDLFDETQSEINDNDNNVQLTLRNYEVTCEEEAKRRNSGTKTKTFEESTKTATICRIQQGRYGVSAPAHHKNCVLINSLYDVSTASLYVIYTAVTSVKIRIKYD
ncbi:hypothetical protein Tco_0687342 [Tanacetum coccineum]